MDKFSISKADVHLWSNRKGDEPVMLTPKPRDGTNFAQRGLIRLWWERK